MKRPRTRWFLGVFSAVALVAGHPLLDATASAGSGFSEEAIARGLDYAFDEFQVSSRYGVGVAFLDLDDDGDPDVVTIAGDSDVVGVFENDGTGHFIDRSATSGIPAMPAASGVSAADFDGDGDLDVHVSGYFALDALLRNDGGFTFTNVANAAGVVGGAGEAGTGCAWADYDGDGWLDLYVANRTWEDNPPAVNHLYRNLGNGTFADVGVALGVDDGQNPTFQALFFDLEGDGDPDLYLSTDKGYDPTPQNRLFENTGGAFTDITASSGTAANVNSMGVAVGDFSHNGYLDLYCTNTTQGNILYANQGDGAFVVPTGTNTASNLISWGAVFLDFDNDGWDELYVCNELGFTGTPNAPNRLFDHDGSWPCVDRAPAMNVNDAHRSFGVATADIDDDGDLDLLVQDTDRIRLYVNLEGENRRHAKFRVVGTGANRFAIGATVSIRIGADWRVREVSAGGSYKSQHHRTLHFGVGSATIIDEVVAEWPWGETRTLTNLPSERTWTVHPDAHLGDADGDGALTFLDYLALRACFDAASFEPGCEIMDFTGDGTVDLADGAAFLTRYDEGPLLDCNGNFQFDLFEILAGTSLDDNDNGIPDACETAGDINGDGQTDIDDVIGVIKRWGPCVDPPLYCDGDTDGNGVVDVDDLLRVILNWSE